MASEPLRLHHVLEDECVHLHPRFRRDPDDQAPPADAAEEETRLRRLFQRIHRECPGRTALCLSGGGIRSATFGLGVLQGLARHGLLGRFTYLSTVSGGGYVGSWLAAWTHRTNDDAAAVAAALAASADEHPHEREPPAVAFLRDYSNYLTPRRGLLSADSWTLLATYLRNVLLNWLVVVPAVGAVLVLPHLLTALLATPTSAGARTAALAAGVAFLLLPIMYVERDLPSAGNQRRSQGAFIGRSLVPLVLAALCLGGYWYARAALPGTAPAPPLAAFVVFGVFVHCAGWLLARVRRARVVAFEREGRLDWLVDAATVALVGGLAGGLLWLLVPADVDAALGIDAYVVLAVPALLGLYVLATTAYVGIASARTSEEDREWWARASAWVLIAAAAWLLLTTIALWGPALVTAAIAAGGPGVAALGGPTLASGVVTWVAGGSARTPSGRRADEPVPRGGAALQWALAIAAPVFVVLLLVLNAWLAETLLRRFVAAVAPAGVPEAALVAVFVLVAAGVALAASAAVNVNRFSLHAMYRNRLIRAYLGASRDKSAHDRRTPSPFTGFDERDNVRMHELAEVRPFPVLNLALNLVRGRRLAWQHRKAAPFTVTPLHAGSACGGADGLAIGYQPVATYGSRISLGTAMAVSGAAVSPNMGYHSSPIVGLLLTVFNGRLGWWLANPGTPGRGVWHRPGPRLAIRPLFAEAFGLTDDRNPWVYLSDGGHFENLALYEMVLRRCRTIVVVDAACDGREHFEDLANAVRKIRVDLGIEIEFTPGAMPGTAAGLRCYEARIHYARRDGAGATDGTLLLLKPVPKADDPVDVGGYGRTHAAFPHESTADQWFDEEQFESYRRLGLETCNAAAPAIAEALGAPAAAPPELPLPTPRFAARS